MTEDNRTDPPARPRRGLRVLITLIACVAVLAVSTLAYRYLVNNPTKAPRRTPEKTARLVEMITAEVGDFPAILSAMGETIPATQVQLKPQLSGRVVSVSPSLVPGGRFEVGQEILRIDPSDFELALAQRESEVLQANSQIIAARAALTAAQRELSIEQGSQNIAKREFELLGEQIPEGDRSLVLREPQLQAAQADVESAQAAIASAQAALAAAESRRDQARVDLQRTSIRAPFNAVVMEKHADIGDMVSATTAVAYLLGTDRAWVELSIPLADTRWVQTPDSGDTSTGSRVEVRNPSAWGEDKVRQARVIHILPQIEAESRMARVLIEIEDPLALMDRDEPQPRLLVGSYVNARVIGPTIGNVIRLPRSVVWDGDVVRVMNDADELEIRRVTVAFKEPNHVLISDGLAAGERVVTTNLATAVAGLPLRLANVSPKSSPDAKSEVEVSR